MAGRPSGSPMAPRAATADSRQRGSAWVEAIRTSAGTAQRVAHLARRRSRPPRPPCRRGSSSRRSRSRRPASAAPSSQARLRAQWVEVREAGAGVRRRRPAHPHERPERGRRALGIRDRRATTRAAGSSPACPARAASPRRRAAAIDAVASGSVMGAARGARRHGRLRLRGIGARWIERRGRARLRRCPAARSRSTAAGRAVGAGRGADGLRFAGEAPHRGWRSSPSSLVAVVVSVFIQLPYYALTPGSAPEVSSLITGAGLPTATPIRGSVLLVYVELTPMRALVLPLLLAGPERCHLSERRDPRHRDARPSTPPRARSTCRPPSRPRRSSP